MSLVEWHIPEGGGQCREQKAVVVPTVQAGIWGALVGHQRLLYLWALMNASLHRQALMTTDQKLREHLLRNNFLFYLALFSCLPLSIRWTHRISECSCSGGCCSLPVRNPQRWNSDHFSSEPSWWWASLVLSSVGGRGGRQFGTRNRANLSVKKLT